MYSNNSVSYPANAPLKPVLKKPRKPPSRPPKQSASPKARSPNNPKLKKISIKDFLLLQLISEKDANRRRIIERVIQNIADIRKRGYSGPPLNQFQVAPIGRTIYWPHGLQKNSPWVVPGPQAPEASTNIRHDIGALRATPYSYYNKGRKGGIKISKFEGYIYSLLTNAPLMGYLFKSIDLKLLAGHPDGKMKITAAGPYYGTMTRDLDMVMTHNTRFSQPELGLDRVPKSAVFNVKHGQTARTPYRQYMYNLSITHGRARNTKKHAVILDAAMSQNKLPYDIIRYIGEFNRPVFKPVPTGGRTNSPKLDSTKGFAVAGPKTRMKTYLANYKEYVPMHGPKTQMETYLRSSKPWYPRQQNRPK